MLDQNASSCRLKSGIFNIWFMIAFILAIYLVYFYQSVIPAYNRDDVRFILNQPNPYLYGRWGTVFIQEILSYNPVPGFSAFIMAALYVVTFSVASSFFGLKSIYSKSIFISLAIFSQFYAVLFTYDQVLIPTAIGDFLAILGLHYLLRYPPWIGVLLLSMAPAFYTSSIHLAATLFVGFSLHHLTSTKGYNSLILIVKSASLFVIALIIYVFLNKIIGPILSPEQFEKLDVTSLSSLNFDYLAKTFLYTMLPTSSYSEFLYSEPTIVLCLAMLLYIGFVLVLIHRVYEKKELKKIFFIIIFIPVF